MDELENGDVIGGNEPKPKAVSQKMSVDTSTDEYPLFYDYIKKLGDLILENQIPDGGLYNNIAEKRNSRNEYHKNGFMTAHNFGGLGLIRAYQMTGDQKYMDGAKKFIDFWMIRQNVGPDRWGVYGTFYDRICKEDGSVEACYPPDDCVSKSTSSRLNCNASSTSGALIALTAYHYYEITGDQDYLKSYEKKFKLIGDSVLGTIDYRDHLTYCHPDCQVKYLMDVCEMWTFLKTLPDIFVAIGEDESNLNFAIGPKYLSQVYAKLAEYAKDSIKTWWNEKEGWYHWYKTDVLAINETLDWSRWYPDTAAQIWPLLWDVTCPEDKESQIVWENLNKYIPNWHTENVTCPMLSNVAVKMESFKYAISHTRNLIVKQINNPEWSTNNQFYSINNCTIDFDLKGPINVLKDSLSNDGSFFKVKIHSALGGTVSIRLRLPYEGRGAVFINGEQVSTESDGGLNWLKSSFGRNQTKELIVKFDAFPNQTP